MKGFISKVINIRGGDLDYQTETHFIIMLVLPVKRIK